MEIKSKRLRTKIDKFARQYDYSRYSVAKDGELEFFDEKGEPFNVREYVKGSPIKSDWERLQKEVDKDLRASKKK